MIWHNATKGDNMSTIRCARLKPETGTAHCPYCGSQVAERTVWLTFGDDGRTIVAMEITLPSGLVFDPDENRWRMPPHSQKRVNQKVRQEPDFRRTFPRPDGKRVSW